MLPALFFPELNVLAERKRTRCEAVPREVPLMRKKLPKAPSLGQRKSIRKQHLVRRSSVNNFKISRMKPGQATGT